MTGLRILFAGGGTGGHVYPALAVATELRRRSPGFEILFVGTKNGLEARVIPETGFGIRFIFSRGVRGKGIPGKALTLGGLLIGFIQSLRVIHRFKPDLVFGSGGYASAPVVLAASIRRITIVLQEQNSIPGLTNRLLASKASRIYIGFERARQRFGKRVDVLYTGNPLREQIIAEGEGDARRAFGLDAARPVLLVFGGSQGAHRLNGAAAEYLSDRDEIQGIIQTGERDYDRVKERLGPLGARVHVAPYISDMNLAYRAATVALARAGALSVSELAAVGLPSVLVPYPYAADDHQRFNAEVLSRAGGALIIDDEDLDGSSLGAVLDPLLCGSGERLGAMRAALGNVARKDACRVICDDIVSLLGGGADGTCPRAEKGS
jgi:UDP-N-acetylglucosamine--N-acetylmuramyl-(pentapeptide) pyrophosphoryl-undecaprenol N-acetylglucosamine transferase